MKRYEYHLIWKSCWTPVYVNKVRQFRRATGWHQQATTNEMPPTGCHQQVTTNGIPPTICCLLAAAASCLVRVKRVTFLSGEGLIFIHYGSVGLTFSNCMLITSYFVFLVTLKEWTLKLFGTAKPPLKGMHVHSIF